MLEITYFKGKKKQMKSTSLHRQAKRIAQLGGFMPSYWSVCSISLSNDRTPELALGSTEIMS